MNINQQSLLMSLRKIRPAPVGAAFIHCLGLDRRKLLTTDQGIFYVNPATRFGRDLISGGYETTMVAALEKFLSPGGSFVDLGANEGYFSILASRLVGEFGRVIAVEPQSRLQTFIRKNLHMNGCSNVRLVQAAISDQSGAVSMNLASSMNSGASSLFRSTKYRLSTEIVQSLTLAELLRSAELNSCDLMKVDVEGAEFDIFMGAADTLRGGIIRHLALEYHPSIFQSRGLSVATLHDHLLACGYVLRSDFANTVYSFCGNG